METIVIRYTIKQALAAIRKIGLTANYSSDWKEFCVNYPRTDARYNGEESTYRTQDATDAVMTAVVMLNWR